MVGRVVIVGGGAAGTAAFTALVRHAAAESVHVIDPLPPGRGRVFDTDDPDLLCNTSAAVMSLDPAEPDEFVRFLRSSGYRASRSVFVPRGRVAEYCTWSYRRHTELATRRGIAHGHVPARTVRVVRREHDYRIDLADGRHVLADHVVVATGTGPPAVPALVREHLGQPGLYRTPLPDPSRRLRPGSRVLILGSKLSAIDATILLCRQRHRVVMTSRSGQLPAVRTHLGRTGRVSVGRALAELDPADPNLPTAVLRLVRRATGTFTDRPLHRQVSVAADPFTRLREEIELAERGHIDWQEVIAELIDEINLRLSSVDRQVWEGAMARCAPLVSRYISAFPLRNAHRLCAEFERGTAALAPRFPSRIEPDGRGGWTAYWPHRGRERFDAVVCATGFQPPPLWCWRDQLRLDAPTTRAAPPPTVDTELRMRFPHRRSGERIWLLGTASYLRTPIVNYLRTAADQADAVARAMCAPGVRAA